MAYKIMISGLVQGIGFRPNIKRIADKHNIFGTVKNCGGIVLVNAFGADMDNFISDIKNIKNAVIDKFEVEQVPDFTAEDFKIIKSDKEVIKTPIIPADIATCDACLSEFTDKSNRRYRHPFISCVNCGPRYSIIDRLPYDRCNITMSDFEMCDECKKEYIDISNIRCHAQTIACNECGPKLSFTKEGDPVDMAILSLKRGDVVAVKDIGGYHFAGDATRDDVAIKIRNIKNRDKKPFAVMFNNIDEIKEYCYTDELEIKTLLSSKRPIVLLKKKKELPYNVCGESDYIGAFLPCNPVQHAITLEVSPLIMTSGNVSGEPIIISDTQMLKLRENNDFEILSHNRRILTPLDDSICRVICGKVQVIRRARGYVPLPIEILGGSDEVFASGGDLKASFCYVKNNYAYMSQYFGDLENADAHRLWLDNIKRMSDILEVNPKIRISDLHPLYLSAKTEHNETLQHHYAHMASVIAEHKLSGVALGFIFDGTGYGEDNNIWGGEIVKYGNGFKRIGHLSYTELLGGDESAKNSRLSADCYRVCAGGEPEGENGKLIKTAIKNHINTVKSSSMGRLFDAVASILGVCQYNSYEGESAIKLESCARKSKAPCKFEIKIQDGIWLLKDLILDIEKAKKTHKPCDIALGFHMAIVDAICKISNEQGIEQIILSGGVFANEILTTMCYNRLSKVGFKVYINEQVPTNDQGIALGQIWYVLNRRIK